MLLRYVSQDLTRGHAWYTLSYPSKTRKDNTMIKDKKIRELLKEIETTSWRMGYLQNEATYLGWQNVRGEYDRASAKREAAVVELTAIINSLWQSSLTKK